MQKGLDMSKSVAKNAAMIMGFSCLWAYVQKGFLSTRIVWAPAENYEFAAGTLLVALLVFVVAFAFRHEQMERYFSSRRNSHLVVLLAAIATEFMAYFDIPSFAGAGAEYLFCIVYYCLHASLLISLFFAWMIVYMHIAYDKGLPRAILMILVALLISRIITSPYFFIWEFFSRAETIFLAGISGLLWLACSSKKNSINLRFSTNIATSSLMKRYLPAFLVLFLSGMLSRVIQNFADDFLQLQVLNVSRETILILFLLVCIATLCLPKKLMQKFSSRDVFFLIAGLVAGAVVGQLLGISMGLSAERLFFDFTETSKAMLLVVSLLLVFLIVYEESVSPVFTFGLFVIAPIILWRFLNLASEAIGPLFIPEWIYGSLLVLNAIAFLVTSLLFLFVFVGSNTFMTFFGKKDSEPFEWRSLIETIAKENELTERETDIFEYLAMGYTAKRIGEKLYISPFTAQNHIRCIYSKLNVNSKQEVLEFIERRKR